MTSLPTWTVLAIGFGTPITGFLGALVGQVLLRKGATELDVWRRREETLRMLRWASEQATSDNAAQARMGLAALDALSTSELLQESDQALVDAVIDSLLAEPVEAIEEAGDDVEVIENDDA